MCHKAYRQSAPSVCFCSCCCFVSHRWRPPNAGAAPMPHRHAQRPSSPTTMEEGRWRHAWSIGQQLLRRRVQPLCRIERKPAGGGVQRTLESINDYALCITYQNLLSAADGSTTTIARRAASSACP